MTKHEKKPPQAAKTTDLQGIAQTCDRIEEKLNKIADLQEHLRWWLKVTFAGMWAAAGAVGAGALQWILTRLFR